MGLKSDATTLNPTEDLVLTYIEYNRCPKASNKNKSRCSEYRYQRMMFTWNNVGYLDSDHAAILINIPIYSYYRSVDVQDIPMLWLDF